MFDRLARYAPQFLALLRVMASLMLLAHGTQKLFGYPAAPPRGLPEAFSLLWVGGVMEMVGGAMLALGLFTRPVAFLLAGEMAVAYWWFHAGRSFHPIINGGELAALYCFVFLYFMAAGPGAWSLDGSRRRG